jgi:hypothetical protein
LISQVWRRGEIKKRRRKKRIEKQTEGKTNKDPMDFKKPLT